MSTPRGDRVSASVFVEAPPALAFEVFTAQIDLWWRHGLRFRSGGGGPGVMHLEPRLGGRLFEQLGDAASPRLVERGLVVAWDPPRALEIAWRAVNFAPHERTHVAVSFAPQADGTRVTLVHSGFAALPPDHPVRHGEPVEAFVRRTAMWWADQLASLRELLAVPWLAAARGELGVRAHPPGSSNPRIDQYHAASGCAYDDKASWCSSFLNWSFARCGIPGTGSALARSWLAWGRALDEPVPGSVVVLWRDDPASWKGHCGFFIRREGDDLVLLGGNQEGEVREHGYPQACVLAVRWKE